MKKYLFFALALFSIGAVVLFASAKPVYAKGSGQSLLNYMIGSLAEAVENIVPPVPLQEQVEEQAEEEFVNPQEVQQVLRELKDIKRELGRIKKQAAKMANVADEVNSLNSFLDQANDFQVKINSGENLRDAIQDFRDARLWDEMNKIRTKIELPKEIKQWGKDIARAEKLIKQKKIQALSSEFGLDLTVGQSKLDEIKTVINNVQNSYNSGDLENAMEEFNDARQDFNPGEISSLLQRLQEISAPIKKIKDTEIKSQIKEVLSEVIENFNDGEFRLAREIFEDNFRDLQRAIFSASGRKYNKKGLMGTIEKIDKKMKEKVDGTKARIQPPPQDNNTNQPPASSAPASSSSSSAASSVSSSASSSSVSSPPASTPAN